MNTALASWAEFEQQYSDNIYDGRLAGQLLRRYEVDSNLLLTSLHRVNHYRNGAVKKADRRTGGLVEALCAGGLAGGLIATRLEAILEPMAQATPFEQQLLDWSTISNKMICDIHAARPDNDFDICLGTGPGELTETQEILCKHIEQTAQQIGLCCVRNRPNYSALIPQALTRRLKERAIYNIVQIETNARLLALKDDRESGKLVTLFTLLAARISDSAA